MIIRSTLGWPEIWLAARTVQLLKNYKKTMKTARRPIVFIITIFLLLFTIINFLESGKEREIGWLYISCHHVQILKHGNLYNFYRITRPETLPPMRASTSERPA